MKKINFFLGMLSFIGAYTITSCNSNEDYEPEYLGLEVSQNTAVTRSGNYSSSTEYNNQGTGQDLENSIPRRPGEEALRYLVSIAAKNHVPIAFTTKEGTQYYMANSKNAVQVAYYLLLGYAVSGNEMTAKEYKERQQEYQNFIDGKYLNNTGMDNTLSSYLTSPQSVSAEKATEVGYKTGIYKYRYVTTDVKSIADYVRSLGLNFNRCYVQIYMTGYYQVKSGKFVYQEISTRFGYDFTKEDVMILLYESWYNRIPQEYREYNPKEDKVNYILKDGINIIDKSHPEKYCKAIERSISYKSHPEKYIITVVER